MFKALCGLAAGGLLLAVATTAPANAKPLKGAVSENSQAQQADEISSQRRYHRRHGGWRGHRGYYGPRYAYRGYAPYYGGYYPAYGYRPYYSYGPSIGFGFGPGIGFGIGPRWY